MATEKTLFAMPETAIGRAGCGWLRFDCGSFAPSVMEEQGFLFLAALKLHLIEAVRHKDT